MPQYAPNDPYADITPQQVAEAEVAESRVREHRASADVAFLRMGYFLKHVRDRRLFRARGYDTYRDWVESPEVDVHYRKAQDLVRIIEHVEPVLGPNLLVELGPTRARALLPLVQVDEHGATANGAELLSVARDLLLLTWKDAQSYVRDVRGRPALQARRPRFSASCRRVGDRTRLVLYVGQNEHFYTAGELTLEPQHADVLLEALKATVQE